MLKLYIWLPNILDVIAAKQLYFYMFLWDPLLWNKDNMHGGYYLYIFDVRIIPLREVIPNVWSFKSVRCQIPLCWKVFLD